MTIKKVSVLVAALISCGVLFVACSTPKVEEPVDFNTAVQGKSWSLFQVRNTKAEATFDRSKLNPEQFGDIYTLQFDNGRAMGKGAPNRYTGPYNLGADDSITFGPVASTMMASIRFPAGLQEHEYFKLFGNADRWELKDGFLFIYTHEAEAPRVMIFTEMDSH